MNIQNKATLKGLETDFNISKESVLTILKYSKKVLGKEYELLLEEFISLLYEFLTVNNGKISSKDFNKLFTISKHNLGLKSSLEFSFNGYSQYMDYNYYIDGIIEDASGVTKDFRKLQLEECQTLSELSIFLWRNNIEMKSKQMANLFNTLIDLRNGLSTDKQRKVISRISDKLTTDKQPTSKKAMLKAI